MEKVANLPITIELSVKEENGGHGGHIHMDDLDRHVISTGQVATAPILSKRTGETDSGGVFQVSLNPGEIALDLEIKAVSGTVASKPKILKIQLDGLVPLSLPANTEGHENGHFVTPAMQTLINGAVSYMEKAFAPCLSTVMPLHNEGGSLQRGGILDFKWNEGKNFIPPHTYHRDGQHLDLGMTYLTVQPKDSIFQRLTKTVCRTALKFSIETAAEQTGVRIGYNKDEGPSSFPKKHWHLTTDLSVGTQDQSAIMMSMADRASTGAPQDLVSTTVTFDSATQQQKYYYTLNNTMSSNRTIDRFVVYFEGAYSSATDPPGWRSLELPSSRGVSWGAFEVSSNSELGDDANVVPGSAAIVSNERLAGFSFSHKNPPTIVQYRAKLFQPLPVYGSEEELEANILSTPNLVTEGVTGSTVGPRGTLKTDPNQVLKDIRDLRDQAVILGWVSNQGILNSLNAKLNEIDSALGMGNKKTATNVLGAFMAEVEALKGKQISNEAYGLLFFNAKYLAELLK